MKAIKLLLCLFSMILVWDCEEGTGYKYFEVKNESSLNQTVYVGDLKAPVPIEFTASGAWTSKIEYSTIETTSGRADVSSSGWITLDPSSGETAGDYSVNIYLNPEKGENVYRALISFICNGEVLEVTLENNSSFYPGDYDDINDPEKIEEAKQKLSSGFSSSIRDAFYELDNNYSTPENRKSLTSSSKILENLWYKSYDAINTCNLLLSAYDAGVVNEQESVGIMASSHMYRGLFHFYLADIFGDIPVQTEYPSDLYLPRTELNEVMDMVRNEMEMCIQYISKDDWLYHEARFVRVLTSVLKNESFEGGETRDLLKSVVSDGDMCFDSNRDGIINSDDSPMAVQCYLLFAYVESDYNLHDSIEQLNNLAEKLKDDNFMVDNQVSADELKLKIRDILSTDWGEGIKYLVNRFMFDYNWDYLELLPLPVKAIASNMNLTQNAGW